jgi:hypothetical protein
MLRDKSLAACAFSLIVLAAAGCGGSDIAANSSSSSASTPAAAKQLVGPGVLGYSNDAPVYNPPSKEDLAALLKAGPISGTTARPMFQKPVNGAFDCWLLDKEGALAGSSVIAGTVNTGWEVKGTGDFNRDGQPDILWRNKVKNTLAVWYMNGTTWQSSASLPTPSPGWNLSGVADFDGDGNPDLLWHNPTTGAVSFWKMQNTTISSAVAIGTSPTTGETWTIRAVGDFFQDRCADIVWQNDGDRSLKVWSWNGTSRGADITWAVPQTGFDVKGADDLSGDGQPDLLLQSPASLEVGMLKVVGGLLAGYTAIGSTNSSRVLVGILPPAATTSSISIYPANPTVPRGFGSQFGANATFSDGSVLNITNTAAWTSSDANIATIVASTGNATGVEVGAVNITASRGAVSTSGTLNVSGATLTKLDVSPSGPIRLTAGDGFHFSATGTFSDSTTLDLTNSSSWTCSNTTTATVTNAGPTKGRVNALATGTATIGATIAGVTANSSVNVFDVNRLLVSSYGANALNVFDINASGTVAPLRIIRGNASLMSYPRQTVVVGNEILAIMALSQTVNTYNLSANDVALPLQRLIGPAAINSFPAGIAVANGEMFVSTASGNDIRVFPLGAAGNATPTRIIVGAKTQLKVPQYLLITSDQLMVCSMSNNKVLTFDLNASGDVAPVSEISGAATLLNGPTGIARLGNEIFISNRLSHSITVYNANSGNLTPVRTISGSNTGLHGPDSLVIHQGQLFVSCLTSSIEPNPTNSILVFNLNDNGNVAPTRTITGIDNRTSTAGLTLFGE